MISVRPARGPEDVAAVARLAWEFVDFLDARYPELRDQIRDYLKEQRFEEKLAELPSWFNPPAGECMIALLDGAPVGIVMLTAKDDGACEMNRMFVTASARRLGVARRLCEALIAAASRMGFSQMRLEALDRHDEALPLYRSLGFVHDPDAASNPVGARVIAMKLTLPQARPAT